MAGMRWRVSFDLLQNQYRLSLRSATDKIDAVLDNIAPQSIEEALAQCEATLKGRSHGLSGTGVKAGSSNAAGSARNNWRLQQQTAWQQQMQQQQFAQQQSQYNQLLGLGQAAQPNWQQQQQQLQHWQAQTVNAPAKRLETEKILVGELVGYRAWILSTGGLLRSLSQDRVWEPGKPMQAKRVPSDDGEGVYAFSSKQNLQSFLDREWISSTQSLSGAKLVTGTVALWGQVVEHELGYRAEWASIRSIEDGPQWILAELRQRYGVQDQ